MERGWESCDDNWENCVRNSLTLSGHGYLGSMRNSSDFSSYDCTFMCKDYCLALKRSHSSVQKIVAELETQDTPQTRDSWLDSKYSPELEIGLG